MFNYFLPTFNSFCSSNDFVPKIQAVEMFDLSSDAGLKAFNAELAEKPFTGGQVFVFHFFVVLFLFSKLEGLLNILFEP